MLGWPLGGVNQRGRNQLAVDEPLAGVDEEELVPALPVPLDDELDEDVGDVVEESLPAVAAPLLPRESVR